MLYSEGMPAYLTHLVATTLGLLLMASPAFAWTADEQARAHQGEVVIHELPVDEGARMEALFYVVAPPAIARAVLWDHASYPQFIPRAKSVKVLEQHGNEALVEQVGGEGPFTVSFVTRRHREPNRVSWTTVRGDVKRNDGSWTFTPAPGGTWIAYDVHVVPKQPVPQRITAFLQRHALPELCEAVRRRIESRAHARP